MTDHRPSAMETPPVTTSIEHPERHPTGPLDILYIGTLPPHPGGSAVLSGQLLAGFAAAGHRVRAIAPGVAGSTTSPHPAGVEVHRFPMPQFEMSPDQPAPPGYREAEGRAIEALFDHLLQIARPGVVIIGRESFCWHVVVLVRAAQLPSVLWVQGASVWGMRNGSLPSATERRLRREMSRVDRVVAVAEHLVPTLAEMGIMGAVAIPNGVDLARFSPEPRQTDLQQSGFRTRLAIPPDHLLVLHASNMKKLKRPGDCVRAAALMAQRKAPVAWVMLGDGPVLAEVQRQADRADLGRRMRFPGWVSHACMPDWLRTADIVVMPSAAEALALVYLETLATGRVLVASDIPGAREVITSGDNGLLFPVGDHEQLARHLLRLTNDPPLRERIAARARRSAEKHGLLGCIDAHLRILIEVVTADQSGNGVHPAIP